jgi:hypothetical protein
MLRKNSTQAKPAQDAIFDGSVRITPTIAPDTSARIQAQSAVSMVRTSPDSSMSR